LQNANKFPEPDPLTDAEFSAWRAFLRVYATVTNELDAVLRQQHGLSLDQYGILITLVGVDGMRLRMGELGRRRLISASKISRAVDELERLGYVRRSADAADRRSLFATLTPKGLRKLRAAQASHHAVARRHMLSRLTEPQLRELAATLETAMPGVVSSDVWPLPE
jgi:DNA-binding MarR family transcriptional regulator